jgi:glycerophosphoryl diester phosphodiesterase
MCYTYEDAEKVYDIDKDIMMEVFIPNIKKAKEFEKTGVPWSNVVAFVTHNEPKDEGIFHYLHSKGVMAIRGSSRNVDREYSDDKISKKELERAYQEMVQTGTDIIEADLGVQAGEGLNEIQQNIYQNSDKKKYFKQP